MNRALQRKLIFLALICSQNFIYTQTTFTDITRKTKINHRFEIFEGTFGGGAAVIDYNNDGFEDVILAGGAGENALYKNNGDGTFLNVSLEAGMDALDHVVTQGVVTADVNKDGYSDLFFTTIATVEGDDFKKTTNVLMLGSADGKFTDVSEQYGINEVETFSTGATFGDFNKDGYPDLYVGNYFTDYTGELDKFSGPQIDDTGGPAPDLLYLNQRGKRFVEISKDVGLNHTGFSFGGVWSDYDNDNDLDLFIVNDFGFRATTNLLYRNEYPLLRFTEVSKEMGFNFGINAMGIAAGDCNLDGHMDYMVTNLQASPFFINPGNGDRFIESSSALQTWYPSILTDEGYSVTPVSWGINFLDADNDMDLDLYITNGALNPGLPPNPNLYFEYVDGVFYEKGESSFVNDHSIGRGSVHFDYDGDGDLDLLVINQSAYQDIYTPYINRRSILYRNDSEENNWLEVKLKGDFSETNGIGSKVEVYVGGKVLIREIDGGSSHESQNSTIAHFGLGQNESIDSVVIRWSGGHYQVEKNIGINQKIIVAESISATQNSGNNNSMKIAPNPFSNSAFIQFELDESVEWSMDVYNLMGSKIKHLKRGNTSTGIYNLENVGDFVAGIYLLVITTDDYVISEKFVVK